MVAPLHKERIFSVDMGTRKLGVCIIDTKTPSAGKLIDILMWRIVDLGESKNIQHSVTSMVKWIWDNREPILACDRWVLEQQLPSNPQMLAVAHAMQAALETLSPEVASRTVFVNSSIKFKVFKGAGYVFPNAYQPKMSRYEKYKMAKKNTIWLCEQLLKDYDVDSKLRVHFRSICRSEGIADLADCFNLGVTYLVTRTTSPAEPDVSASSSSSSSVVSL